MNFYFTIIPILMVLTFCVVVLVIFSFFFWQRPFHQSPNQTTLHTTLHSSDQASATVDIDMQLPTYEEAITQKKI